MTDDPRPHFRQRDPDASTLGRLLTIHDERNKQEVKYPGTTCATLDMSWTDRMSILGAEYGEAIEEAKMLRWPGTRKRRTGLSLSDRQVRARLRHELVQVGAIVLACMERIDADDEAEDGLDDE